MWTETVKHNGLPFTSNRGTMGKEHCKGMMLITCMSNETAALPFQPWLCFSAQCCTMVRLSICYILWQLSWLLVNTSVQTEWNVVLGYYLTYLEGHVRHLWTAFSSVGINLLLADRADKVRSGSFTSNFHSYFKPAVLKQEPSMTKPLQVYFTTLWWQMFDCDFRPCHSFCDVVMMMCYDGYRLVLHAAL